MSDPGNIADRAIGLEDFMSALGELSPDQVKDLLVFGRQLQERARSRGTLREAARNRAKRQPEASGSEP